MDDVTWIHLAFTFSTINLVNDEQILIYSKILILIYCFEPYTFVRKITVIYLKQYVI